jgi:PadR family transcriptional regulator PadR
MKLSQKGLQVLVLFMSDPRQERSGAEITKTANVGAGTLYPLLSRFEKEGILTSRWETIDPTEEKRPRRRFYTITGQGQNVANAAARDIQCAGGLAWTL